LNSGFEVLSLYSEVEVKALSKLLWGCKIGHHWVHQADHITLYVLQPMHVDVARRLHADMSAGILTAPQRQPSSATTLVTAFLKAPVTLGTILVSFVVFLAIHVFEQWSWLSALTYYPLMVTDQGWALSGEPPQWYRLMTPALLHFGWMHVVFNSLWVWEFGRRVEHALGAAWTLAAYIAIAIVANVAQAELSEPSIFGGLSGLVYGLLALVWLGGKLLPRWCVPPSNTLLYFMLGWLLLGLTGFIDVLGFGSIANHAHVGGLLAGVMIALAVRFVLSMQQNNRN
jgi:GlpG protein